MKAPIGQSGDFKPAPSGAHPAILIQMIDLGTQEGSYEGKVTHNRKVRMQFELHSEDAMTEDGKPMVIGREFKLSSHENAALRQFIEGWRGKSFTDEEAAEFDYRVMLGKPCILNVTHNKAANGKTYANIDNAMRLMKGMSEPVQVNPSVYFYIGTQETGFEDYDANTFNLLPQWLKEKIWKSPEYAHATGNPPEASLPKAEKPTADDVPFDDDIPF